MKIIPKIKIGKILYAYASAKPTPSSTLFYFLQGGHLQKTEVLEVPLHFLHCDNCKRIAQFVVCITGMTFDPIPLWL